MNYGLNVIERIGGYLCAGILSAMVAWLFFDTVYAAALLVIPLGVICIRAFSAYKEERMKERLLLEFKDAMQAVCASLMAGYSMENAWREAESEMRKQHGDGSIMYLELHRINAAVGMSRPLESMLSEFAARSGCDDIESFAEVFAFAKRSGGNYIGIIKTTIQKLSDRIDVEAEIETELAGKKLEGHVMDLMPAFILGYLKITSPDFVSALYRNVSGILVMCAALILYIATVMITERMLKIQV
jgi:tight adherence protein B